MLQPKLKMKEGFFHIGRLKPGRSFNYWTNTERKRVPAVNGRLFPRRYEFKQYVRRKFPFYRLIAKAKR